MSTITRQRTYDWDDPSPVREAASSLDGLAILEAIGSGDLPTPPALRTLGIAPVQAAPGTGELLARARRAAREPVRHRPRWRPDGPAGHRDGLRRATLLPVGVGGITAELNVRFLRAAVRTGGPLLCVGEAVNPGRRAMVAAAQIVDADQRVIATAGSTCLLKPG